MIGKAVGIVLKREGWLIPFVVLLAAILDYWREGQISVGSLICAALIGTAVLLIGRVPDEIRKLEGTRELL